MKPKICAVLTGENFQEIKEMFKEAKKAGADLVELRIDYLKERCDFPKLKKVIDLPVIATNRPISEGGFSSQPEEVRLEVLLKAAESGFDYVDLEISTKNLRKTIKKVEDLGVKTIISFHNFSFTPKIQELLTIFKKVQKFGAEICKIVTTAKSLEDNLTCFSFLDKASKRGKVVSFCMGKLGVPSRILSPLFGGYYTYASIWKGKESAPGQLTVGELRKIYRLMGFEG